MTHEELQNWLQQNSEKRYADFTIGLIPYLSRPLLGIRIPRLRALAKRLARQEGLHALDKLSENTHEEILLRAFIIGYARPAWEVLREELFRFVPLIDNWATCDALCGDVYLTSESREQAWAFLRPYLDSSHTYEQRFAVVMILAHFLTDDDIGRSLDALRRIEPAGYYAAMAVGWALATAFTNYPDFVFDILCDPSVSRESRRLAHKKILESRRTDAAIRTRIKALVI